MTKKLDTIKLSGKAYALVPTRIKAFREDCPNGLIETKPTYLADNKVAFEARILKDKSNANSGEGTGHSMGDLKDAKAFEKLETIAIGRALAILGYMSSGDVASFEEMEEFLSYKEVARQTKIQEIKEQVDAIKDVATLREFFKNNKGYGVEVDSYIMTKAGELKNAK